MGEVAAIAYLRALREYQSLTQEEIADRMGTINVRLLQHWEVGKHKPSAEHLGRWILALNGSADTFFALLLDDSLANDPEGAEYGRAQALSQIVQARLMAFDQAFAATQHSDEQLAEILTLLKKIRTSSAEHMQSILDYMRFIAEKNAPRDSDG